MSSAPLFLVIDFHAESRYLLVKTLTRKFPGCTVRECDDAAHCVQLARAQDFACIVVHRTFDVPGAELVRQLRDVDPDVPIVMVSGIDREPEARAAGATSFLNYDEWLRLGTVVQQHITKREADDDARGPSDAVA